MTPREMIAALQSAGLVVVRQTGAHVIMHKQGLVRPVPVPNHVKTLKRDLQNRIIREAGFTAEEFSRFLK